MIHALKTLPMYFRNTADGYKSFEVRKNDRPFQPGDYVALNEWKDGKYTGKCILLKIVYILCDPDYCKEGYVILGLKPCKIIADGENNAVCPDANKGGIPVYDRE